MADDGMTMGYLMGQSEGNNNSGFGGDWGGGLWAIIILAMLGFGGGYGFGGGFGGGGGLSGVLTRAELYDGFATQNIDSAVRGVQQGICDSTYALAGTITNGFHGVDSAICNLGHQISDCCCTTQRAIDGINFNMAKGFCDLGNVINTQTRDIIDNQNANYRGIMDFMVQSKLDALRSENEALRLKASQADQNAVLRAAIDASTAEIIRRTGNECPVPAYVVPNPNCCYGNPVGVSYGAGWGGYGRDGGCGCGC